MLDENRKKRLRELFAEGYELADGERRAFVVNACADDSELRDELADLLQVAGDGLDSFLSDPAVALPLEQWPAVPIIPDYSDLTPIGEGGMGMVYRAQQLSPVRRTVAIKAIRPGMDSRQVLARFDAEREALARMTHPYIATVHGAGSDEAGRPYLVMEFVDGKPITDYCDAEALELDDRLELFAKVCDAVDHAHRRGVLHRDLKPSNVLVVHTDDLPMPKVIDFGIAKALEGTLGDDSIHTLQGALLGTPDYMSPEQLDGDGRNIDTRTDVYALGAMLYELLTGDRLFDPERLRAAGITGMARIVRDEVPPKPSTRLRNRVLTAVASTVGNAEPATANCMRRLHGDVDWVVMKALEKDPERRYAAPRDLAEDLRRLVRNLPVEAGPPSSIYRIRKFTRRHRGLVIGVSVVMLLLTSGLIGMSILASRNETLAQQEQAARAEAVAASQRLRVSLYRSQMRFGAESINASGGVARAREVVAAWLPDAAADVPDLRGFEWHLLAANCNRELQIAPAEAYPISLSWLTDGRLLSTHWQSAIAWDGIAGAMLQRWDTQVSPVAAAATSRDGRLLALSKSPKVVALLDTVSGEEIATFAHDSYIHSCALAGDGSLLLCYGEDRVAVVWDTQSRQRIAEIRDRANGVLAISDDGALFAVGLGANDADVQVRVYQRDHPQVAYRELRGPGESSWRLAFDAASQRLGSAGDASFLRVWSLATGELELNVPHVDVLRCIAFDPTGKRVAVGCHDYVTYVYELDNGDVRRLSGHTGIINGLAWSPDGERLATISDDKTLRWWNPLEPQARRERQLSQGSTVQHAQLTFSADGNELAVHWNGSGEVTWNLVDDSTRHEFRLASDDDRVRYLTNGASSSPDMPAFRFASMRPDDGTIALVGGRDSLLWLWPRGSSSPVAHTAPRDVRAIAWASDGQLAMIDSSDHVRMFDGATGQQLLEQHIPQCTLALAASPIDNTLAIGSVDQSVLLWSKTRGEIAALKGHTGHVQAVAFSPAGTRLASGGRDGTVRIWDVAGMAEVASLRSTGRVIAVAFSPDGKRLASLDSTGRAVVWDARGSTQR
ncbi:MAG: serine/threonine protein kinase/WD40 repeat protein [Planctomycetota bacterium]|jgi:serine/threonine protein kinase/WD40 repeat protein